LSVTILEALKALRDRGWLFSREHPTLRRGEKGRVERSLIRGSMVLASNGELRRWCRNRSVVVDGVPLGLGEPIPESAACLQLFPRGETVTMPFPWGVLAEVTR
jgi:hypothetical protein